LDSVIIYHNSCSCYLNYCCSPYS